MHGLGIAHSSGRRKQENKQERLIDEGVVLVPSLVTAQGVPVESSMDKPETCQTYLSSYPGLAVQRGSTMNSWKNDENEAR